MWWTRTRGLVPVLVLEIYVYYIITAFIYKNYNTAGSEVLNLLLIDIAIQYYQGRSPW